MKYMNPEMEIIELEAADIITLSGDDAADDKGNGGNVPGVGAGGSEWD